MQDCIFGIRIERLNPLFKPRSKVEKTQSLLDEVPFYCIKGFPKVQQKKYTGDILLFRLFHYIIN